MLSHIRSQGTFVSSSGVYHSHYVLSWRRSLIRTIILIGRQWRPAVWLRCSANPLVRFGYQGTAH